MRRSHRRERRKRLMAQIVAIRWLGAYGRADALEEAVRWEYPLPSRAVAVAVQPRTALRPVGGARLGLVVAMDRCRPVGLWG